MTANAERSHPGPSRPVPVYGQVPGRSVWPGPLAPRQARQIMTMARAAAAESAGGRDEAPAGNGGGEPIPAAGESCGES